MTVFGWIIIVATSTWRIPAENDWSRWKAPPAAANPSPAGTRICGISSAGVPRFPTWPDRRRWLSPWNGSAPITSTGSFVAGSLSGSRYPARPGRCTSSAAEDRDAEGAYPYAVISYRLWRDRFHADPSIAGSAARVNGRLVTIVLRRAPAIPGFARVALSLDIWVHLTMIHLMVARLRENHLTAMPCCRFSWAACVRGADIGAGQRAGQAAARRLAAEYPQSRGKCAVGASLVEVAFELTGTSSFAARRAHLRVHPSPSHSANVANLPPARSLAGRIRPSPGDGRRPRPPFAQMFTEGLLLAIAATGVGLLLAMWMGDSMLWLIPRTHWPLS